LCTLITMAETETAQSLNDADAGRMPLRRPMVERDGYTSAMIDELKTQYIQGSYVYGLNDENIGEVSALV